jgi:1-deoxy-D-xylulose-5-phosphate synthase (EC 2.2.1.7)
MPGGTGLDQFAKQFPDRYVDVGICEQHAVTFAGGLATQGMKPVVAIYSTFMQRAYDQILHDICLQNLPVLLCLDRAGLVGEDGATHHGVFDLSYLRHIPNLSLLAPRNGSELKAMLTEAFNHGGPVALRYPRGCTEEVEELNNPLEWGRGETIQEGGDIAIIAVGRTVNCAIEAAKSFYEETSKTVTIFNCRFVKPLPYEQISEIAKSHSKLLILEENVLAGGFSGAVLEFLNDQRLDKKLTISRLGLPDCFIEHGLTSQLLSELHLDSDGILAELEKLAAEK